MKTEEYITHNGNILFAQFINIPEGYFWLYFCNNKIETISEVTERNIWITNLYQKQED